MYITLASNSVFACALSYLSSSLFRRRLAAGCRPDGGPDDDVPWRRAAGTRFRFGCLSRHRKGNERTALKWTISSISRRPARQRGGLVVFVVRCCVGALCVPPAKGSSIHGHTTVVDRH